ncbi:BLOC-1-related complex subunit 6 [Lutzomyia longipalpis]|uniref:BLOC-1-related complex subunit 6 C-terminal helix domain-containing protein n=2 Tax=Lutzomyia longipalpis TaxID=7200 RepID=A0A1B0CNY9_LUTLO|nr:BLOC-1-related complex subunit 6 [Lutzomyia longipalpis]
MENDEIPDVMTASYSEIMNSNPEGDLGHAAPRVRPNRFPYNLEGTVSMEGDMTHFIAEDLEHKIKLSSPISKSRDDSRDSTPSTSGFQRPGSFLMPQDIDSNVLNDVEMEAQYLAASVDNLTENLCNLLHSISSITADNVEVYKNSVSKLTDCMDANIKNMYTIMAKTEEISNAIKPTKQLMNRIREIKRLVDMLENTL